MRKSVVGIPLPESRTGIDLPAEARKARHRLYPVTVVYSIACGAVLALAARQGLRLTLAVAATGVVTWTWVEYLIHRYVLHGVYPDEGGPLRRWLNRRFDDLHWRHHQQPWNGNHVSGTIADTAPFIVPVFLLSLLTPCRRYPRSWPRWC